MVNEVFLISEIACQCDWFKLETLHFLTYSNKYHDVSAEQHKIYMQIKP